MAEPLMTEPLVSVIIPIFNRREHVSSLFSCLRHQTYRNFDALIGDGGSTDGTVEEVRRHRKGTTTMIVPLRPGYKGSRQELCSWAAGKYLAFLDSDDVWTDAHKLEDQVRYMEDHPDCALTYANMQLPSGRPYLFPGQAKSGMVYKDLLRDNFIPISSVMIRADSYQRVGGFSRESFCDDYELWLTMAKSGMRFHYENHIVYRMGDGPDREMRRLIRAGMFLEDLNGILERVEPKIHLVNTSFIRRCSEGSRQSRRFLQWFTLCLAFMLLSPIEAMNYLRWLKCGYMHGRSHS